jgi:hypothetical protein
LKQTSNKKPRYLSINMPQQLVATLSRAMRAGDVVRVMRWSKPHGESTETKESVEFAMIKEKHATNSV